MIPSTSREVNSPSRIRNLPSTIESSTTVPAPWLTTPEQQVPGVERVQGRVAAQVDSDHVSAFAGFQRADLVAEPLRPGAPDGRQLERDPGFVLRFLVGGDRGVDDERGVHVVEQVPGGHVGAEAEGDTGGRSVGTSATEPW